MFWITLHSGRLELGCSVSVLGFYDSLCRKEQIGRRKLHRWSCLSGTVFNVLDRFNSWLVDDFPARSRLVPWLCVVKLLGLFCLESFARKVCMYGIRGRPVHHLSLMPCCFSAPLYPFCIIIHWKNAPLLAYPPGKVVVYVALALFALFLGRWWVIGVILGKHLLDMDDSEW